MNILVESRSFHPNIGGLEMMAEGLSRAWQHQGHDVCIMTETLLEEKDEIVDLEVMRQPSRKQWFSKLRQADVFFQNGVSLNSLPLSILANTPVVFRHPNFLRGNSWKSRLKRWSTLLGYNIASCRAVEKQILGNSTVVPNTFRPVFDRIDEAIDNEDREGLLAVGRLTNVKSMYVAIEALHLLHKRGIYQTLLICGDGPKRPHLESLVEKYELQNYVTFNGWTEPVELAELYTHAEVALIPSGYEPFGIVALEAAACGTPIVATNVGGLPESVGPCGVLTEKSNPEAFARGIERVLRPEVRKRIQKKMPGHVDKHRISTISHKYMDALHYAKNNPLLRQWLTMI